MKHPERLTVETQELAAWVGWRVLVVLALIGRPIADALW